MWNSNSITLSLYLLKYLHNAEKYYHLSTIYVTYWYMYNCVDAIEWFWYFFGIFNLNCKIHKDTPSFKQIQLLRLGQYFEPFII